MARRTKCPTRQPAARKPATSGFIPDWTWNILIVVWALPFVAQPMVIPTSSMHNTLLTGDHLLVDKLAYSPHHSFEAHLLPYEDVRRGDIVVFRHPAKLSDNLVKRVIGVPGDRIRLVSKQLVLNGRMSAEPYVTHIDPWYSSYRDNFPIGTPEYRPDAMQYERALDMLRDDVVNGELVVPPGQYFAMGDNRDNSSDSRYWGLVPRENIIGKPVVVLWSYDAPTADLEEYNLHHVVDLAEHFFTRTRWDRTLRLVEGYPLK
jgi:signal peptidase I